MNGTTGSTGDAIGFSDPIAQDYQKAVREFKDREYSDAVRDIGRAAETLLGLLCHDCYAADDIPEDTGSRLDKLDKTEDGLPSSIGKTLAPAWWLRNKADHPTEYEITKADARDSLLRFQMAVEKRVEMCLDADVVC